LALPEGDSDYSTRWALIKAGFSRQGPATEWRRPSRIEKGERGLWQRRYWEHLIRDERDYERHVDYIHYNPVKHGYVAHASDWPYSSIHRYIAAGVMTKDWGSCGGDGDRNFGER
jgi:putative transposase